MALFRRTRERGSALSMTILLSVVLTGLVMALSYSASIHSAMAGQMPRMDAAYYAAEAGLQHAVWKFKKDNQWRATAGGPLTGSVTMGSNTYNYSVTCLDNVGDATLAWKFDEYSGSSTVDSTGRGNTGVFHGGVSWDTPGRSGSCLKFDGVNGYVDCGNNASTNITGDMSFSAWIKMNSAYYDQKIGGNQNGQYGGYKLCVYNSKVEFEVRDASNYAHLNRDVAGGTILTMGSWYHIVGVYSASGHWIKTYVNGKLDRTLQGDGTGTGLNSVPVDALGSTTGNFVMGREPWDPNLYYYNGWMDDVRVFNRSLTAEDVKALFDTTVDLHSTVSGPSGTAGVASASASIPTPPAPTIPVITSGTALTVKNWQVNGDLAVDGNITCSTGNTTIGGNLTYSGSATLGANAMTVQGTTTAVASSEIKQPTIDFAALRNQAGQTVNGNSKNDTYTFNSLGGNKVIWIKGDLENPTVTIGGTYAAGGTFVVDGQVKFSNGSTTLGSSGYPVYIVSVGNITQTAGTLNVTGALYTTGSFTHKSFDITGPVYAKQGITNNANATCTFTATSIPWFDTRAVAQTTATLPLYTTNHQGVGP